MKRALTLKSKQGLERVLITPIEVYKASEDEFVSTKAIWDTGATGSAITRTIVDKLNLVPTGMAIVATASGEKRMNTYTVDILLPKVVVIKGIVATEVDALASDCDALIGMDIITLGDFSITNLRGYTCMSFRIPSSHEIDYVKSPDYGLVELEPSSSKKKKKKA